MQTFKTAGKQIKQTHLTTYMYLYKQTSIYCTCRSTLVFTDVLKFPSHLSDIQQVLSDQTMKCTALLSDQTILCRISDSFQELWLINFLFLHHSILPKLHKPWPGPPWLSIITPQYLTKTSQALAWASLNNFRSNCVARPCNKGSRALSYFSLWFRWFSLTSSVTSLNFFLSSLMSRTFSFCSSDCTYIPVSETHLDVDALIDTVLCICTPILSTSVQWNACGASKSKVYQTDGRMDKLQSDPYVKVCFAGATKIVDT